jgi:CubicO group peptidase (beta-lactamase class C family)
MRNCLRKWASVMVGVALFPIASAFAADPAAELAGLWGCERSYGPEVRGDLTISRSRSKWSVSIGAFETAARSENGEIVFELAGDRGKFRGRLASDGKKILGHWIQPPRVLDGVRYATPVELARIGRDEWRGPVAPLDDRLSLYLVIRPEGDGSVSAFLRNPGRNAGLRLGSARVVRDGLVVRLVSSRAGEVTGRYDEKAGTLSFVFPFLSGTFDFTRRGRDEAAGFYPRTSEPTSYLYRPPSREDDAWPTATLSEAGLDSKAVSSLIEQILSVKTESSRDPYIQGLLIARHGRLALEEYFYGFSREAPHDMRSASKSLTGVATGIAIDHGAPFRANSPVYPIFREYGDLAGNDARKKHLSVENLLTMTSGFVCDDNDDNSPGNEDTMQDQTREPDWYKYTLNLPMVRDPGEKAVYCSAGINLLGGVIAKTTGVWLPDWLRDNLAEPLSIRRYHVNLTPQGDAYMGGGIKMRPRDFMKLGQVMLDGGRWNGRQIVSREWVERSLAPHSGLNARDDYGYGWHLLEFRVGQKTYRAFNAGGNGGQLLVVVPGLDLVVMITAGNYGDYPTWSKFLTELVPQRILPAVVGNWAVGAGSVPELRWMADPEEWPSG